MWHALYVLDYFKRRKSVGILQQNLLLLRLRKNKATPKTHTTNMILISVYGRTAEKRAYVIDDAWFQYSSCAFKAINMTETKREKLFFMLCCRISAIEIRDGGEKSSFWVRRVFFFDFIKLISFTNYTFLTLASIHRLRRIEFWLLSFTLSHQLASTSRKDDVWA